MLLAQDGLIGLPIGFRQFPRLRALEKIAALYDERSLLATLQAPPDGIFPIGGVQRYFPDIVTIRARPPGGLFCRNSLQGLPQIGPMPGFPLESLFEQLQNHGIRVHCRLPTPSPEQNCSQMQPQSNAARKRIQKLYANDLHLMYD